MFLIHNSINQADLLASALVDVHRLNGKWYTESQEALAHTLFLKILETDINFSTHPPIQADNAASQLNSTNEKRELIELLIAFEMLCNPIPESLSNAIDAWARALGCDTDLLKLSRELAHNAITQATSDFYRHNWIGEGNHQDDPIFQQLVKKYGDHAYGLCVQEDPDEYAKWNNLQNCPIDSLGRHLWDFYHERGFKLPGELGAGNSSLAHHDWIHLIAGYDTTPVGELEVTAFMASSSQFHGVTLGFIGAISILETGLLQSFYGADKFGKALSSADGIDRLAQAIQRGKACIVDPLIDIDYFAIADMPLKDVRASWWVQPK
jgi:hypothetical protein